MTVKINIGIDEAKRKTIVKHLSTLLADTYTLYLKTQSFHWNVTGSMFQPLHAVFEEQYEALSAAVDEVAERIRSLGFPAPASYSQFTKLTSIKEETGVPSSDKMIQQLLEGHETIIRSIRKVFDEVSETGDEASADLLTQRLDAHEKTAWMLRSFLEN